MRLLHHTSKPLERVTTREQRIGSMKPHGLWVSVEGEDDWRAWCESEQFALDTFELTYEITLKPSANVLILSNQDDVLAFSREYEPKAAREFELSRDWVRLAQDYNGIIIAPYQYELRCALETYWYYPWDCASGCIWNAEAIANVAAEMVASMEEGKG